MTRHRPHAERGMTYVFVMLTTSAVFVLAVGGLMVRRSLTAREALTGHTLSTRTLARGAVEVGLQNVWDANVLAPVHAAEGWDHDWDMGDATCETTIQLATIEGDGTTIISPDALEDILTGGLDELLGGGLEDLLNDLLGGAPDRHVLLVQGAGYDDQARSVLQVEIPLTEMSGAELAVGMRALAVWPLDESPNSDTAEDATGLHDGTYNDPTAPGSLTFAHGGPAPEFMTVDQHVLIPHHDDMLVDEGAVSAWFKTDVEEEVNQTIFCKDDNDFGDGGHIHMALNDKELLVRLQSIHSSRYVRADADDLDEWRHAVVTFGPAGLRLYLDGELVDEASDATWGLGASSGGDGNREPIYIGVGAYRGILDTPFQGYIKEVSFFGRQLDDDEVAILHTWGLVPGAPTYGSWTWITD